MKLRDLAASDSDSEVTGFAIDHRKVAPGSVFGAFKGSVFNGEDFVGQAVSRGAVAVVARPEAKVSQVPHLSDPHPRLKPWGWQQCATRTPGGHRRATADTATTCTSPSRNRGQSRLSKGSS